MHTDQKLLWAPNEYTGNSNISLAISMLYGRIFSIFGHNSQLTKNNDKDLWKNFGKIEALSHSKWRLFHDAELNSLHNSSLKPNCENQTWPSYNVVSRMLHAILAILFTIFAILAKCKFPFLAKA